MSNNSGLKMRSYLDGMTSYITEWSQLRQQDCLHAIYIPVTAVLPLGRCIDLQLGLYKPPLLTPLPSLGVSQHCNYNKYIASYTAGVGDLK